MEENGGRLGKVILIISTLICVYVSGGILLDGLTNKGSSLMGTFLVITLIWWVWSFLVQIIVFAFGRVEVSYEEVKDDFRKRGYKVTEINSQSDIQISKETTNSPSSRSGSEERLPSNIQKISPDTSSVRMRIGTDSDGDDDFLRDVADYFRAT